MLFLITAYILCALHKARHFSLCLHDSPVTQTLVRPSQAGDFCLPPGSPSHPSLPCVLPFEALCFCPLVGLRQWRAQTGDGGLLGLAMSLDKAAIFTWFSLTCPNTWSCLLSLQEWEWLQNPRLLSFLYGFLTPSCLCKQFLYENSSNYSNSKKFL